jgi:hypothetical protein
VASAHSPPGRHARLHGRGDPDDRRRKARQPRLPADPARTTRRRPLRLHRQAGGSRHAIPGGLAQQMGHRPGRHDPGRRRPGRSGRPGRHLPQALEVAARRVRQPPGHRPPPPQPYGGPDRRPGLCRVQAGPADPVATRVPHARRRCLARQGRRGARGRRARRRVGLFRRRLHAAAAHDRGRDGRDLRRLHAARRPGPARHVALDLLAARGRRGQPGRLLRCRRQARDALPVHGHRRGVALHQRRRRHPADPGASAGPRRRRRGPRRPASADAAGDAPPARAATGRRRLGPGRHPLRAHQGRRPHHRPRRGQRAGDHTAARFDPASGDGIIVLQTGNSSLATQIASEWVFWQSGEVDTLVLFMEVRQTLKTLVIGGLAIIVVGIAVSWWTRPRRAAAA